MMNVFYILILQVADNPVTAAEQSSSFDWTALGVIISAVVVFATLCRVLIKFGKFNHQFVEMGKSLADISKNITKNSFTLKSVTTFLYTTGAVPGLFENNSPIVLTKTGWNVLEKSGAKDYIDNHIESLIEEMEQENLNTALDVQNFSSSLFFQKIENENFNKIKSFVYNNPTFEKVNITLGVVINVMAIYLRDKYLEKHSNLLNE